MCNPLTISKAATIPKASHNSRLLKKISQLIRELYNGVSQFLLFSPSSSKNEVDRKHNQK